MSTSTHGHHLSHFSLRAMRQCYPSPSFLTSCSLGLSMRESQHQPRLSSTQGTATPNSIEHCSSPWKSSMGRWRKRLCSPRKEGVGNLSMLRLEGGKMRVRCGERISTSARLMERFVTSDEGRKVQDRTWVSCFCNFVGWKSICSNMVEHPWLRNF